MNHLNLEIPMITTDQFQIFVLKESMPIADTLRMYLSQKGHEVESFKISGKELRQLFHLFPKKEDPRPLPDHHIQLYDGKRYYDVAHSDILYIQANHIYIEVYLSGGKKIIQRCSFKGILQQLSGEQFVQTHRSFIVNLSKIDSWDKANVYIEGTQIPISRAHRKSVHELLKVPNLFTS